MSLTDSSEALGIDYLFIILWVCGWGLTEIALDTFVGKTINKVYIYMIILALASVALLFIRMEDPSGASGRH